MGSTYYRVVGQAEWEVIERTDEIPGCHDEWPPYVRGEGVFLFDQSTTKVFLSERAASVCEGGDGPARLISIKFTSDPVPEIEDDKSQSGWSSSRFHRGPISRKSGTVVSAERTYPIITPAGAPSDTPP